MPLAQGIDTQPDPKQLPAGKLLVAENVSFNSPLHLKKRNGHERIGPQLLGGGSIASARSLASLGDHLTIADGSRLYDRSAGGWFDVGALTGCEIATAPLVRDAIYEQQGPDIAIHSGGLAIASWIQTNGTWACVYDAATWQPAAGSVTLTNAHVRAKCFAIGAYLCVIYQDAGKLRVAYADVASAATWNYADLVTDAGTSTQSHFDASLINGRIYVAYRTSGNTIAAFYLDSALARSAVWTGEACGTDTYAPTAIFGTATQIWILYYKAATSTCFLTIRDGALTSQVQAPVEVAETSTSRAIGGVIQDGVAQVLVDFGRGAALPHAGLVAHYELESNGTATLMASKRNLALTSKPFLTPAGLVGWLGVFLSESQPTLFLVVDNRMAGVLSRGVAGVSPGAAPLTEAVSVGGVVTSIYQQATRITSIAGTVINTQKGIAYCALDFNATPQEIEMAGGLYFTGGLVSLFDGQEVAESNFLVKPELAGTAVAGSGGGLGAGAYSYALVYEYVDATGRIQRSEPLYWTAGSLAASSKVTLTIAALDVTNKTKQIGIVIYRTEVDGSIFYRLNGVPASLINDRSVATLEYVDGATDGAIIGNEQLYTAGGEGEKPNASGPATSIMVQYRGRLIVVPSEQPTSLAYSKQVVPGWPVEFSEDFRQNVNEAGGPVTAAAVLDEKLVLFKRSSVYMMAGDGPAPNGTQNDFSTADHVSSDAGCTNQRSIAVVPNGLMFQSAKGIMLLGRDSSVSYVGAPVEAYNSQTVTSAKLIPNAREVRFSMSGGVVLVYNYQADQWSVNTGIAAVDATIAGGLYHWLKSDGSVWRETPGVYTDDGAAILMRIATSWLSFAKVQGHQRTRRMLILGEYKSAHALDISVAYDFSATPSMTTTYTPPAVVGPYQVRVHLERQKAEAMQVTIAERQDGAHGEGLSLSNLAFEVGIKRGLGKLPATQTVG